jgi:rSAM/selenodomain-associated transferase 1
LTIGIMARAPVAGRCKTRLARTIGFDGAARLYEAMLRDRIDALAASTVAGGELRRVVLAAPEDDGLRALTAMSPPGIEVVAQRGADLGERLANAFRDLHREGELVCLTDSDSPTLPFHVVLDALARPREDAAIVAGPCEDGGYYLIGMQRLALGVLEGIPWSTSGVFAATRERCRTLGLPLVELTTWYDVDDDDDLERLAHELASSPRLSPRTAEALATIRRSP